MLAGNESLLSRDFVTYAPFFERMGLKARMFDQGSAVDEESINELIATYKANDVQLLLKKGSNDIAKALILRGQIEMLRDAVLIIDEVDDLLVDETPNQHYAIEHVALSKEAVLGEPHIA